jgi:hypothetical protein
MKDNNIYIVNSKVLSKYAYKKLHCSLYHVNYDEHNNVTSIDYDTVPEIESYGVAYMSADYGDKIKVRIYSFNFLGSGEYISEEIIDKKDYIRLDWPMCMYLYNTQGSAYQDVIIDYIAYLKIYQYKVTGEFGNLKSCDVYPYGSHKPVISFDYNRGYYTFPYTDWLIKQVDTKQIDLDQALINLDKKEQYELY